VTETATTGGERAASLSPIELRVPADPVMSRIARLTASGVASLAGCTLDELQNVKIAVSEALIILIEHGDGERIDLEFDAEPGTFKMTARSLITDFDPQHSSLELCRVVLDDVSDSYSIDWRDGTASISVLLPLSAAD
jgi:anti-sigma regulatory factor (Ser/Thr protein kinase)